MNYIVLKHAVYTHEVHFFSAPNHLEARVKCQEIADRDFDQHHEYSLVIAEEGKEFQDMTRLFDCRKDL